MAKQRTDHFLKFSLGHKTNLGKTTLLGTKQVESWSSKAGDLHCSVLLTGPAFLSSPPGRVVFFALHLVGLHYPFHI